MLTTNFGYNLRIGHAPYSTGRYIVPQDLWDTDPGITFKERELLFNRTGERRAVDYALHHPGREFRLSLRKIEWLWRPDSDVFLQLQSYGQTPLPSGAVGPMRVAFDVAYGVFLAFAGVALLRWRMWWRSLIFR